MHWRRRLVQHIAIALLVSMALGLTGIRFVPVRSWVFGIDFDLRTLAVLLPLLVVGVVVLTFRCGRVFCSWICPTHLYLEGVRMIQKRAGRRRRHVAVWLFAVSSAVFVTAALMNAIMSPDVQIESVRQYGLESKVLMVWLSLFVWLVIHLGLLRWRFCVHCCPYGLLMRLFKTDTTPIISFDAAAQRCIDCRGCDAVCPYELDVRGQCHGELCTNCSLCVTTCDRVLGEGKGVLRETEYEPPEDSDEPTA